MTKEKLAAQPGSDENNALDWQELERLFNNAFPNLMEIVETDRRLTLFHHSAVMDDFCENYIRKYDGPADDATFLEWASDVMTRLVRLCSWTVEFGTRVRAVIARVLGCRNEFDNLEMVIAEIENDTWLWAANNMDSLLIPGTGSTCTRICEMAKDKARGWRKKQIVRRDAVERHLASGKVIQDCEVLSEVELTEMKAQEQNAFL